MTAIDIGLIIIALLCFVIGWRIRGIYLIIIPVAFFAGILAANYGHTGLLKLLTKTHQANPKGLMISYAVIFLAAVSFIVLGGMFLAKFLDTFSVDLVDKIMGGILLMAVMAAPVYYMIIWADSKIKADWFKYAVEHSLFLPVLSKYAAFLVKLQVSKQMGVLKSLIR